MLVDDEILIRRFFVLANPRLEQRGVLQSRESKSDILADALQRLAADYSFTVGRVEFRSPRIVSNLESAPLISRNPIHEMLAVVAPDRNFLICVLLIAGRSAEEENFLSRNADAFADGLRKKRSQPGAASEYVSVCFQI